MNYRLFINKYWFFRYKILFINKPKLINKPINQPINQSINEPTKNTQLCKIDVSEKQNIDHNNDNNNDNNNNNIKNIKTNSIFIRQIREFRP